MREFVLIGKGTGKKQMWYLVMRWEGKEFTIAKNKSRKVLLEQQKMLQDKKAA